MKHLLPTVAVPVVALLLCPMVASGQLPQTRMTSLFPPGAQRGTSVEVTVTGGTDLDEVDQLVFSHPGIQSAQKLDGAGNGIANTFVVSVDASVLPGVYDARTRGLFGVSNPRAFRVDSLAEAAETEPNNQSEQATVVPMNTTINARANGGTDVDFYRFTADAGQTVVVRTEAANIDSPMQPVVQLYSADGRRIAESRRIFSQDAALVYTAANKEDLTLRVADVVYGGGNEYQYRLSIDTRPLVDFVIPSTVRPDQPTVVTAFGRYLPGGASSPFTIRGSALQQQQVTIDPSSLANTAAGFAPSSAMLNAVWYAGLDGNLVPLTITPGDAVTETDSTADQTVTVPVEISGHLAVIGDVDAYRFSAVKGELWNIEVFAERMGFTTDPLLIVERVVTAADGSETFVRLATEDDNKQNPGGADLPTLSSDPSFLLTAPEDGVYRVRVQDRFSDSRGDPGLCYRLSIRKPEPDFSLVVFDAYQSADGKAPATTGAVSLRKGGTYQVTVYAYRTGGHDAPIHVTTEQLPEGITCAGALIGPGATSATLVLSAADAASELASQIRVIGRSGDAGAESSRVARVATLVHEPVNGLPRRARISDSLVVGVMKDEEPVSISIDPVIADISQDQQLLIPVRIQRRGGFDGKVDLTFLGVPANVDAPAFAIDKGSDQAVARLFFKDNAPPSAYTIVINGACQVPYRRNPWLSERAAQKVKDAESLLAAKNQAVTDTAAALEAAKLTVTKANEGIVAITEQIAKYAAEQKQFRDQFTAAQADFKASADELKTVKDKLAAVTAVKESSAEDFDTALVKFNESVAAAEAASVRVAAVTAKASEISAALAAARELETKLTAEKSTAEANLATLTKSADEAQAAVAAAQKVVEQAQAQKTAADDALKKADEATKAKNLNTRTVSAPLQLTLHPAPGKLAAQVPDGGVIHKLKTLAVKVTLTRKNNFAGPMKLALVLPPGIVGVSSDTVEMPASHTESTLTLAAAADAVVADIPNAVIRATGDVNGRSLSIDIPIAIKVAE